MVGLINYFSVLHIKILHPPSISSLSLRTVPLLTSFKFVWVQKELSLTDDEVLVLLNTRVIEYKHFCSSSVYSLIKPETTRIQYWAKDTVPRKTGFIVKIKKIYIYILISIIYRFTRYCPFLKRNEVLFYVGNEPETVHSVCVRARTIIGPMRLDWPSLRMGIILFTPFT